MRDPFRGEYKDSLKKKAGQDWDECDVKGLRSTVKVLIRFHADDWRRIISSTDQGRAKQLIHKKQPFKKKIESLFKRTATRFRFSSIDHDSVSEWSDIEKRPPIVGFHFHQSRGATPIEAHDWSALCYQQLLLTLN